MVHKLRWAELTNAERCASKAANGIVVLKKALSLFGTTVFSCWFRFFLVLAFQTDVNIADI